MANLNETTVAGISSARDAALGTELTRLAQVQAYLALKRDTATPLAHSEIGDWDAALTSGLAARIPDYQSLVNSAELSALASGVAATPHTHPHTAITDWDAALTSGVGALIPARDTLIRQGDLDGALTGYAPLVHTHPHGDVSDWDAALHSGVRARLAESDSVEWDLGATFAPSVRLATGGHIISTPSGLQTSGLALQSDLDALDAAQHDALTVVDGATVDLTLSGQELTAEVIPAPGSGIVSTPEGLALDFGTGANQAARGDHIHDGLHDAATVANSDTVALALDGQELTATVRLQLAPGAAGTPLAYDSAGLYVPSGTLALAGHAHPNATTSVDGMMSATDKTLLDSLTGDGVLAAWLALTPSHDDFLQWHSGTGTWENRPPSVVKLTLDLTADDIGLGSVPDGDWRDRANHSGTQTASTISDFNAAVALAPAVVANTAKVSNATHTGDVTGSTALTIAADAVTNAKLANMATATLKGRNTAGTGDPEDLSAATVRALLDVPQTTRAINTTGLLTGGDDLSADLTLDVPIASQAEAEAGASNTKAMTPLRVSQAIAALAPGGGASGVATFLGLTDTPSSYSGQGLKGVRVNTGETALEFYAVSSGTGGGWTGVVREITLPALVFKGPGGSLGNFPVHLLPDAATTVLGTGFMMPTAWDGGVLKVKAAFQETDDEVSGDIRLRATLYFSGESPAVSQTVAVPNDFSNFTASFLTHSTTGGTTNEWVGLTLERLGTDGADTAAQGVNFLGAIVQYQEAATEPAAWT